MKHWQKWLMAALVRVALAAALSLIASGGQDSLAADGTIYVDADAVGANNGTSWEDAFTTLQPALDGAVIGDQIWVAEGIYTPTHEFSSGDPRSATFQLKNGVALYGGFDPSVGDVGWQDRDWVSNVTILSGDIGTAGDPSDNSYHVFYHPSELALGGTAVLDGFMVTGGNANGGVPNHGGGGMYNNDSSPAVINCTFLDNSTGSVGGGMYNHSSSPAVTNCTFSGNWTNWGGSHGGGMYNYESSPAVTNCILWEDSPDEISNDTSQPTVTYSDIQGGYDGIGNIDADPLFVDPASANYHLGLGSPCVDAGTNDAPNLPDHDFEGDPRVMDGDRDGTAVVDMGIDELAGYALYLPLVFRGY